MASTVYMCTKSCRAERRAALSWVPVLPHSARLLVNVPCYQELLPYEAAVARAAHAGLMRACRQGSPVQLLAIFSD